MPANLLASASKDIKIWNLQASTGGTKINENTTSSNIPEQLFGVEVASFAPDDSSTAVNVVRWSHDNQQLAVAGNDGTLRIRDAQGAPLETILSYYGGSDILEINAVRFANKSRYVLYGGSDKIINVWDRKESKFTEPLKGHQSTITCVDLNVDETIVASSNISGQILVHNRQKSNTWDNLTVLTKRPINTLEYSFFKRGLLAAGGEDGSLRLWDTSASSTALQTFENAHYSEIKGIVFSPFNSHLMCSSGLDKRIVLYDVGKKSTLKTIHTDSPLTALGFKTDGVTIVAGTLQGKILVYDLRAASKPMCTLLGHEPHPIRCLHFQEKDRSSERRPTILKKQNHTRTSSNISTLTTSSNKPSKTSPPSSEAKKNYMDMFSPVKDIPMEDSTLDDTKPKEQKILIAKENKKPKTLTNIIDTFKEKKQQFTQHNSIVPDVTIKVDTKDLNPDELENQKLVAIDKPTTTNGFDKTHGKSQQLAEMVVFPEESSPLMSSPLYLSTLSKEHEKNTPVSVTTIPTITSTITLDNNTTNSEASNNIVTGTTTNFQLQVIGSVVDECLQEFRMSLRNDIQNLHLELLRQFHIQKTDVEMMLLKYCGETMALREEVERLREENQRLKMKF